MARAPPPDDSDPAVIEFGIPVLDDRLEEASVTFPATRDELEADVGTMEVPFDAGGHTVRLGDAIDELDADRFESKNELLEALHPVFEAYRQRRAGGLMGQIRSILPF